MRALGFFAGSALVAVLAMPEGTCAEVRVITAPGVGVLPRAETPPQRIEVPAKPLPPPAPPVTRRFAPVVIEDAATLVAGGFRLIQPGVAALGADETCRDGAGVEWPCGRRMLANLRGFVRMRPVTCEVPKDARRGRFETACRLGEVDFGDVVVRRGWARAVPGGPHGTAEDEARRERRGIFGAAPGAMEMALPPLPTGDLPPDMTTAPLAGGEGAMVGTGVAPRVSPPGAKTTTAPVPGAPMPLGR